MKTLTEVVSILKQNKAHLCAKYPIKSMAIFGSYTRNEQADQSDIDIMVEFNDQIGIRFIDLADEIEKLLEAKVDLVSKKGMKERYYKAIKADLLYV